MGETSTLTSASSSSSAAASSSTTTETETLLASRIAQIQVTSNANNKHCLVCYSDLTHPCVTPCGHNEVCGVCHLRLRHLHSDKKCPMCKQENHQVIVDSYAQVENKQFEDYPLWGDELGADFVFRDDVGMFFLKDFYQTQILSLFGYHCGICNQYDGTTLNSENQTLGAQQQQQQQQQGRHKTNNSAVHQPIKNLSDHLRIKHRLTLCELCIEHKRDFVSRLPRFTPTQLKAHMTKGDGAESGFRGHPICDFCRPKRFYDLTQLHMHLQRDHYKCHVCDSQGLPNQYFRDYSALEKHFDRHHFLCQDQQCIAVRFVVFENEIDLRAHELSVHGASSTGSTKIQLQFRVRREGYSGDGYENQTVPSEGDFQYGIDGEAFVPEGLQQQLREPDTDLSHPLHAQRTAELRTLAASIRAAQVAETAEEAFPSLARTTGSQADGIRMGWTAPGTLQRLTNPSVATNSQEQFPSLASTANTTSKSKSSVGTKMRAGGISGSRQFSAMRNAAMANSTGPTTSNWASQVGTARTSNTGETPSTTSTTQRASTAMGMNLTRQTDLSDNNFPSLGPATQTRAKYPVIPSSGTNKSLTSQKAPSMTGNEFPSLGVATKTRSSYPIDTNGASTVAAQTPPVNNFEHFPPPPLASVKGVSVREKLLGDRKAPPTSGKSLSHFQPSAIHPSTTIQGMALVEEMKAALGLANYKDLKTLTKRLSEDDITPDAYVDHAAALFDGGFGDSDFWRFIPALLLSCPNQSSAGQALRYMEDIRAAHMASVASMAPSTSWTAPPLVAPERQASTKLTVTTAAPPPAFVRPVGVAIQPRTSSHGLPQGIQGNSQKSVWGKPGASSAVRAKAPKISVAIAAANQPPQSGTATAFMAKEAKQNNQQNQTSKGAGNATSKSKKKKNKQSEELRALAFGK